MGAGIGEVKKVLYRICDVLMESREELTQIDSKLGDGDLGISMDKGAAAIRKEVDTYGEEDVSGLLAACGSAFNKAAPSTLGTLLSFSLLAVAGEMKEKAEWEEEDIVRIPAVVADVIAARGKAKVGDKTILDALVPFAEVLEEQCSRKIPFPQAWQAAAKAAERGMESTIGMTARIGRAKWLDGRNKECPDGGAVLCVKIIAGLTEFVCDEVL